MVRLILAADIARALFFIGPCSHGVIDLLRAFEPIHKGKLCGLKFLDFAGKLVIYFFEVCLENPGVSERIPILEHFQEMVAAEALLVGQVADIALHVRGARAEREVEQVLFELLFNEAEGAFVVGGKGVV